MRGLGLLLVLPGCAVHEPAALDWDAVRAQRRALNVERVGLIEARIAAVDPGETAGLWHRLGEARRELSRDVVLGQLGSGRTWCEMPRLDTAALDQGAALAYAMVGVVDPDYARGDEALGGLAASLDDLQQRALAEQARRMIVERWPDSPEATDAWLMLAESWFETDRTAEARDAYARVMATQDPRADFARYKHAWTLYLLGDEAGARAELAGLAEPVAQSKAHIQLRDEALKDLAWMMVYGDHPEDALATLTPLLRPEERAQHLGRLAETLRFAGFLELADEAEAGR